MKVIWEREIKLSQQLMANRTFRSQPHRERSKGVHAQAINVKLAQAAGKLDDLDDAFADGKYPLLPGLGVAWEEFRASHYTEDQLIWQPFELERDDIFGTPDGLLIDDDALWECKFTSKKIKLISDCWLYLKQGMTYCAMHGAINRVQYDVCWFCGNYNKPFSPLATSTLVEFTDAELEQWWSLVVRTAADVKGE